jgi:inner membrane protein
MSERTKKSLTIKGLIISALILLLLIPTLFINNLVQERQIRQKTAFNEISSKWAQAQTIAGPIVSIPYWDFSRDSAGHTYKIKRFIHVLPDKLNIKGTIRPEKRYRGIYETVVYTSKLEISGSFINLFPANPSIPAQNVLYDEAFVSIGITDLRGIEDSVSLTWNNNAFPFNSGVETTDIYKSGINAHIRISPGDTANTFCNFAIALNLKGSQYIYFTPVGKETIINVSSNWPTPSFDGAFLPDKRDVTEKGFTAYWKVLHLNRNYPQSWLGSGYSIDSSSFGVNLILSIDNYVKTDRSIKYAILFIGLTFLIFFFLELLNNKPIHPLQYILIGFALCIFYTLLLSISEQMTFNLAYLISCLMTIGLITWYAGGILRDKKLAALVAGNLVILYGFIFTIIQMEDFALLTGSLGLFVILAIVMFFSRKIDWKGL